MNTFRFKTSNMELEISGERDFVENQIKRFMGEVQAVPEERVRADFCPQAIPYEAFLTLKCPRTPLEHLVTGAYYLEKYSRQSSYSEEELAQHLGEFWDPQVLREALALGWIEPQDENSYTLTFSGEQYVQGGF